MLSDIKLVYLQSYIMFGISAILLDE